MRFARSLVLALALLTLAPPPAAQTQSGITISSSAVAVEFPDRLTFTASIRSVAPIARVVLEYGVDQLTCGTVVAKAFPQFAPGTAADLSWTWEMRRSGSEPPGATIWYRWRVTDSTGAEQVSNAEQVTWLDDRHRWQRATSGMVTLHWYDGSRRFADDLLAAAAAALTRLEATTGVTPRSPIDVYIYANTNDMRDAVLYEPGWTGGQAYSAHDIVIIGIDESQLEWGKRTVAHELTHVLVGHLTFSCLGSVPTWLNEGIAVYGEGGADPSSRERLQQAIRDDSLISVRALSGGFSEHPDAADLSYTQSYSLVDFLINSYGQERLLRLFAHLRDGTTVENGLTRAYGFGLDGLEDRWRAAIGARPRRADNATPTAAPRPSPVPTYPPIGSATATPVAVARPAAPAGNRPPILPLALALALASLAVVAQRRGKR